MRRKIRDQREKTLYAQERRRKAFIWNGVSFIFISIMVYSLYIIGSLILERM